MSILVYILAGLAVGEIVKFITERCLFWRQRRQFLEDHKEYIEQLEAFDCNYTPETVDRECAGKCSEYLKSLFPSGIKSGVSNMSKEELSELFPKLFNDIKEILDVDIDTFDFYSGAEPPENYYCGYYSYEDNSLHVNADLILDSTPELVEEQIYTMFHEMKHARQWQAISGDKYYGYSDEQLLAWAEDFRNYIPSPVSDELYRKQPVEMDSFGFESLIKELYENN